MVERDNAAARALKAEVSPQLLASLQYELHRLAWQCGRGVRASNRGSALQGNALFKKEKYAAAIDVSS